MTLLVVVGLAQEARIARAAGVTILVGGGRSEALARAIEAAVARGSVEAILSFGVAGALSSALAIGVGIAADAVRTSEGETVSTDAAWTARLRVACGVGGGAILGVDAVAADPSLKRALFERHGAVAVDMESHLAARVAAANALPFAVLRVVSDRADDALPAAAVAGLRADGGVDVGAVLRSLARSPGQLPALLRTGHAAGRAFRALTALRRAAGGDFKAACVSSG